MGEAAALLKAGVVVSVSSAIQRARSSLISLGSLQSFAGMPEEQLTALPPDVRQMVIASANTVMSGGGMPNGNMMQGMQGVQGNVPKMQGMNPMMHDMNGMMGNMGMNGPMGQMGGHMGPMSMNGMPGGQMGQMGQVGQMGQMGSGPMGPMGMNGPGEMGPPSQGIQQDVQGQGPTGAPDASGEGSGFGGQASGEYTIQVMFNRVYVDWSTAHHALAGSQPISAEHVSRHRADRIASRSRYAYARSRRLPWSWKHEHAWRSWRLWPWKG
jgi:hypothetical protein